MGQPIFSVFYPTRLDKFGEETESKAKKLSYRCASRPHGVGLEPLLIERMHPVHNGL